MSDNPVTFNPQAAGQPPVESEIQEVDGSKDLFGADQIKQIVDKTVNESMSNFFKQQKSQMDKLESRINKNVEKQVSILKKSGIDVTPEMEKGIEQATREEVVSEYSQEDSGQPAGQPAAQSPVSTDPVFQAAMAEVAQLEKKFGVELFQEDPEASMVNMASPFKFTQSYEQALQAKAERMKSNGGRQRDPMAGVHLGGGGSTPGNPLANRNNPDELWDDVKKSIFK